MVRATGLSGKRWGELLRRGVQTPPPVIARWLVRRASHALDGHLAPKRDRAFDLAKLLSALDATDIDTLWGRLGAHPYPARTDPVDVGAFEAGFPGTRDRILAAAADVARRRVDLLGSGPVDLCNGGLKDRGDAIPWHTDFKSGFQWPRVPFNQIDVLTHSTDADVKVPWELSRLQWLVPAGQAYLLSGEEDHALCVRDIVADWIAENPLGIGVNWACTMDVALRAITLTWVFHVFKASPAWVDADFRFRFLKSLYLHGDFISRHLEWTDVNSNHLTSNAAGLVFVGLFFGEGAGPRRWAARGWDILTREIEAQIHPDGVDFEASSAYHRLVTELFAWPAYYRRLRGLTRHARYDDALGHMGAFVRAYTRPDGSPPNWGDADDGRVLPFGGLALADHRHLYGLIAAATGAEAVGDDGDGVDLFWLGFDVDGMAAPEPASRAFRDGGVFVMADGRRDHVFMDCGPVGLAGRGGHGHNDCLGFEAVLAGSPLIADRGAFVYTPSPSDRNGFRATASHSTPEVDGAEQNRFVRPDLLWTLHDDATPDLRGWVVGPDRDVFVGVHGGYERLDDPVTPVRSVVLDKTRSALCVWDQFEGHGRHDLRVPYHLAPGVGVESIAPDRWRLTAADGQAFLLVVDGNGDGNDDGWQGAVETTSHSRSYGVREDASVLVFRHAGDLAPLCVAILPEAGAPDDISDWMAEQVAEADRVAALREGAGRLCVLINAIHAKSGGGVTYLKNVAPLLAGAPGVDLHVAIEDSQRDLFADALADAEVHVLPESSGQWALPWREQLAIPKLAGVIGADVTFSPANYGPIFAPGAVIMIHNAPAVLRYERRPKLIAYWIALYIMTVVSLVFCRRAVAVSTYAGDLVTRFLPSFIKDKITVVPHGVSNIFAPSPSPAPRENFLLAVSDIYAQKNFETLIAALAIVRERHGKVSLKIAGRALDAAYMEKISGLVADYGLGDAIEFLGHQDALALADLYRRCGVFVFPSLVETFGIPLLEAMASGAPVVVSDAAAMPEILGTGGLLFDPKDPDDMAGAILKLLEDPALAQRLGAAARARAEGYSWGETARRTLAVLRRAKVPKRGL